MSRKEPTPVPTGTIKPPPPPAPPRPVTLESLRGICRQVLRHRLVAAEDKIKRLEESVSRKGRLLYRAAKENEEMETTIEQQETVIEHLQECEIAAPDVAQLKACEGNHVHVDRLCVDCKRKFRPLLTVKL